MHRVCVAEYWLQQQSVVLGGWVVMVPSIPPANLWAASVVHKLFIVYNKSEFSNPISFIYWATHTFHHPPLAGESLTQPVIVRIGEFNKITI